MEIVEGKQKYILPEVTSLDPLLYPNLPRKNLNDKMKIFLDSNQQVFALLGQAGSGKSVGLQKLFVENVLN